MIDKTIDNDQIKLIENICGQIEDEQLNRRKALNKIVDSLWDVSFKNSVEYAEKVLSIAAEQTAPSLVKAGFLPINHIDLVKLFYSRESLFLEKTRKISDKTNYTNVLQKNIKQFNDVLENIKNNCKISLGITNQGCPWEKDDWDTQKAFECDLAIFKWVGDHTGNIQLGCVLIGSEYSNYLEHVVCKQNLPEYLKENIWKEKDTDQSDVIPNLVKLSEKLQSINILINHINHIDQNVLLNFDNEQKLNFVFVQPKNKISNNIKIQNDQTNESNDKTFNKEEYFTQDDLCNLTV